MIESEEAKKESKFFNPPLQRQRITKANSLLKHAKTVLDIGKGLVG